MSAPGVTGRASLYRRLSGVLFLAVIIGLVLLTVALYNKTFKDVVMVTLKADRIGNQLQAPADVKLRGLIVGEVRSVESDGDVANLELALDPDEVDLIPKGVEAQLLPKTLFGEKFVSLVIPEGATDENISEGDIIPQDRSETARETETAINNLLPLLQTLKPQEVSTTLNALSTALRGRGNQLGENLELVDKYLEGINPEIPALGENFRGLADFADTLEAARPDLIQVLDNSSFLARSLVDTEPDLSSFLTSTTTSTGELDRLLRDNEQRLIVLARDSKLPLQLFQKYSPEFPCLAQGLAESDGFISDSFGGLQPGLHITLEVTKDQGGYTPNQDETQFLDKRGPDCFGLPRPGKPAGDFNFKDGFRDELPRETTQSPDDGEGGGGPPGLPGLPGLPAANATNATTGTTGTTTTPDPAQQRAVMGAVLGPVMGVAPPDVPDLAYLLFGPMARGTEVGLK